MKEVVFLDFKKLDVIYKVILCIINDYKKSLGGVAHGEFALLTSVFFQCFI